MVIFGAVIFCVISVLLVFLFILPLCLKILQLEQYRRLIFNPIIISIITLITILTSIWIYTQTILIVSGNTEQFKTNISTIFTSDNILNHSENEPEEQVKTISPENRDTTTNDELLRTGFSISKYADCLKLYENNNADINKSDAMFFCKKTEKYCLSIQYLLKLNPEPNQERRLTTGQTVCKTKGWYRPFNKYSKDFNFN